MSRSKNNKNRHSLLVQRVLASIALRLEAAHNASIYESQDRSWADTKKDIISEVARELDGQPSDESLVEEIRLQQQAANKALRLLTLIESRYRSEDAEAAKTNLPSKQESRFRLWERRISEAAYLIQSWYYRKQDAGLRRVFRQTYDREYAADSAKLIIKLCHSDAPQDRADRHMLAEITWKAVGKLPEHERERIHDFVFSPPDDPALATFEGSEPAARRIATVELAAAMLEIAGAVPERLKKEPMYAHRARYHFVGQAED